MRARDPRLEYSDQAVEEVSPPTWFSLYGAPDSQRPTAVHTLSLEE